MSIYNYFAVGHAGDWDKSCGNRTAHVHVEASAVAARGNAGWRGKSGRGGRLGGFSWESPRYFVTDPRGYAAVARHVSKSAHDRIVFNATVTAIHYGNNNHHSSSSSSSSSSETTTTSPLVSVVTASGQEYRAKHVITTFSAGVVNQAIESNTLFYPPLPPWKAAAFNKVSIRVVIRTLTTTAIAR